jgi:hypothetical protein
MLWHHLWLCYTEYLSSEYNYVNCHSADYHSANLSVILLSDIRSNVMAPLKGYYHISSEYHCVNCHSAEHHIFECHPAE